MGLFHFLLSILFIDWRTPVILLASFRQLSGHSIYLCTQWIKPTSLNCATCTHTLLDVMEYYAKLNSSVQLIFLDVSKAFDKLIPSTLGGKRLDRGVPAAELKLLRKLLTSANRVVKFGHARSSRF